MHYIIRYLAVDVNKNNVRPDLADILVRDHHLKILLENTQQLAAIRDHDLTDTAAALVKFKIRHLAQPAAVPDIDHFFRLKIRKQHVFPSPAHNFFSYYMPSQSFWFRFHFS